MANTTDPSRMAFDDPPLPPGLWPRVAGARRRQLRFRRAALAGGTIAACALLLLPASLPRPGALPDAVPASHIASAASVPQRVPVTSDRAARLRILDRELQDAYRRGSGPAGIAQLWEARAALLREGAPAAPVRPVRI